MQKPSAKSRHQHAFDIFWAISNKYKKIVLKVLKLVFYMTPMLLHENVLQALEAANPEFQSAAVCAVSGMCIQSPNGAE